MLKELYHFLSPRYQNVFLDYRVNPIPRSGAGKEPHTLLYELINRNRADYKDVIFNCLKHKTLLQQIKPNPSEKIHEPYWNNGYLPGLDIITLYTMVHEHKPKKYIEVGSGHSTKVVYKAKRENKLDTEIISIDPNPRSNVEDIVDKHIRSAFEEIAVHDILSLGAGDILFIDNSHRILPNSDAMVFFLEVLPYLNDGVIVHLHDIYLPYDYPEFMCRRWYTEQYGLAMYLMADPNKYKPLFPAFFVYKDQELNGALKPFWDHPNMVDVERHGGSFWFEIKGSE